QRFVCELRTHSCNLRNDFVARVRPQASQGSGADRATHALAIGLKLLLVTAQLRGGLLKARWRRSLSCEHASLSNRARPIATTGTQALLARSHGAWSLPGHSANREARG